MDLKEVKERMQNGKLYFPHRRGPVERTGRIYGDLR